MTRTTFAGHWMMACWALLFAYISLVPFYYLQPIQLSLQNSSFTLIKYFPVVLVGLLFFTSIVFKSYRRCRTPLDTYLVGYLCLSTLSLIGAQFGLAGGLKLVYYTITGLLLFFLVVSQMQTKCDLKRLVELVVIISGIVAFYGLTVYASGRDYLWGWAHDVHNPYFGDISRLGSSLGNAVFAGTYFVLCLPLALWLWACDDRLRWIWKLCVWLMILALVLTFSRGAWLSALIGCGIFLHSRLTMAFKNRYAWIAVTKAIWVLLLLLMTLPIFEGVGLDKPIQRFGIMLQERMEQPLRDGGGESFRLAQYRTAWRVIQDHPVLGVGFGNLTRLFEYYKHSSTPIHSLSATTENMYLMVVCETGVLGVLAFVILLGQLLLHFYRGIIKFSEQSSGLLLACFGAVVGTLINMTTWDALNQPSIRMTFWMIVGIAFAQLRILNQEREDVHEAKY